MACMSTDSRYRDMKLREQTGKQSLIRTTLQRQAQMLAIDIDPFRILQPLNLYRRWTISRNERVMRDCLLPYVNEHLKTKTISKQKTVIDYAVNMFTDINDTCIDTLFQNLKLFLFAGHDTTAGTICWIFYHLEQNRQCLEKLRTEHDAVLGKDGIAAVLTKNPQLLNSLPYTTAIIKESLRLNPPALSIRQGNGDSCLIKAATPPFPTKGFTIWDGRKWPPVLILFWISFQADIVSVLTLIITSAGIAPKLWLLAQIQRVHPRTISSWWQWSITSNERCLAPVRTIS